VTPPAFHRPLWSALRGWWREQSRQKGAAAASAVLARELWAYLRDFTPERRRRRYGDMEYDWEHRVNTTSGTVGWRERLLGLFYSPYQPTDAALFQEMMASLPIDFSEFTFVDLGSGKGRTLLMASEYPLRKIVGVEILPELHRAAEENIANYQSTTQQCTQVESVCADACAFDLPEGPLVVYLFNPLPEAGLHQVLLNLEKSLRQHVRPLYVLYQNPLLDHVLEGSTSLKSMGGTDQYSIHTNAE
jgi:SAM-dependent methyltransferase